MPCSVVPAIAGPFESVTSATDFPPEIVRHAYEVALALAYVSVRSLAGLEILGP